MKFTAAHRTALTIYLAGLAVYSSTAGPRLRRPSSDTHFVYQAKMFLEKRLDLGHNPPTQNDWAEVETLILKDGSTVSGAFFRSVPTRFRSLDGKIQNISPDQIQSRPPKKFYVSFPPFPALLFLPFVAIFGLATNDVLLTVLLAPLGPLFLFFVLRRFAARGDSLRTERDDLWLTALFAFGSVYFYSSVLGQVWYTAHIVSVVLTGLFLLASLDARHPFWAGLCLGAIVLTRPQMGFWGIFFLAEMFRAGRPRWRTFLWVAIPVAAFGIAAAGFNYARFHSFTEFGHSYLNVRWTDRIQRYGLFNYMFLSRNLTAAFFLLPKLITRPPWIQISWHGLSMLFTTPALVYLLWPAQRPRMHNVLWLTIAPIAVMGLLYQNDGWVQFGFRFSLDYFVGLILLLAVGGRTISKRFIALILFGVIVNLFGAITFGRMWQFYFDSFLPISPGEY